MQLENSDSDGFPQQQLPPAAYAAITLFNLGLTYNLEGLNNNKTVNNNNREAASYRLNHIKTAISMYELCNECLRSEDVDAGPHFMMIVANNLGVCCELIGDKESAKQFFEYLLSVQMFLTDSHQLNCTTNTNINSTSTITASTTIGSPSVSDGFWCNTSSLVLSDCSAAAA